MRRFQKAAAVPVIAAVLLIFSAVPAAAGNGTREPLLHPAVQPVPELACGDGFFSGQDLLLLKAYALHLSGGEGINMTEFLLNRRQLLALSPLSLGQLAGISSNETAIMTPGETAACGEDATVLGSGMRWKNGRLTAGETGTAFILRDGKLTTAAVCAQHLAVSLPENTLLIDPGASAPVDAALNYPVNTRITYTSSDPAVAAVDENGLVTALKEGTATVTASVPGGQCASREIRVIRRARSVTLSQDALKVKHDGGQKTLTADVFPANAREPLIWTSSDPAVATVDENGVVTGVSDGYATITCRALYSGTEASCEVKTCNLIQVALTFDDGPSSSYTMQLLDVLEEYDVTATFFFVGNRINTARDAVRRIAEEEHEMGYHTWSHEFLYNMDQEQIREDYRRFQAVLRSVCGQEATVYRAPGGSVTDVSMQTIPLPHIYWTKDTRDWATRNTEKVKEAILDGLKDGSIILLHDIHYTTYTGTKEALAEIRAQDLDVEFLTVTQLLSRDGTPPQAHVTYYKG